MTIFLNDKKASFAREVLVIRQNVKNTLYYIYKIHKYDKVC